tara:strand:- start:4591 stop:4725 length:135 start_codon:yes stop_codon:yes gene_type:complete
VRGRGARGKGTTEREGEWFAWFGVVCILKETPTEIQSRQKFQKN